MKEKMEKQEQFVIGMVVGAMLILIFYCLLFFPVVWLYTITPVIYREYFKSVLAIVFTIMLINSARGAFQSLNLIKKHHSIIKKIEDSIPKNEVIQSYLSEGLKYRLLVEMALFN